MRRKNYEMVALMAALYDEGIPFRFVICRGVGRIFVEIRNGVQIRIGFEPENCEYADNYWYVRNCGHIEEYSTIEDVVEVIKAWT